MSLAVTSGFPVCLSLRVHHTVHLSFYLSVYPSLCLYVDPSLCLPVCPSFCLSVYTSLCHFVYSCICLYVYFCICLYVYPSLCLSIPTFAFLPMRRCAILFILLCVSMSSNLESYSVYPSLCFHVCVGLSLCLSAYPSLCRNIRLFSI